MRAREELRRTLSALSVRVADCAHSVIISRLFSRSGYRIALIGRNRENLRKAESDIKTTEGGEVGLHTALVCFVLGLTCVLSNCRR